MSEVKTIYIKANIVKFIIGLILLSVCYSYLKYNPAERIALYSGFELIFQKIEIAYVNLRGGDWALLEQKFALETQFLDLIHLAEEKWCSDPKFLLEINSTYQNLLTEQKVNIENYIARYTILANEFQAQIESDNCTA